MRALTCVKNRFKDLIPVLPLAAVFFLALLCVGLFHELHSGVFSIVLCVILIVLYASRGEIKLYINFTSVSVFVIVISYALTAIWANDRGEAVIGFVKFLPALLFLVLTMQYDEPSKRILSALPHFAVFSVIVSAALMHVPVLEGYFSVAGRLSGFFEYPNTFALFSLISLLIILTEKKSGLVGYIESAILIFGILYSGSRIVFALAAVSIAAALIISRRKKAALVLIPTATLSVAGIAVYSSVTGEIGAISRFLTTSFGASTFVGRILYYLDALPVILKHPLGSGYLSYYLTQSSFQRGVYSVRYLHNDILQFAFDIGWMPALLFIGLMAYHVFKKGTSAGRRLILLVFFAHMLFDFDIQFTAMFFLLLLLTDDRGGREISLKNPSFSALPIASALFASYMTLSLAFSLAGNNALSAKIFRHNTENNISLMLTMDADGREDVADLIISDNDMIHSAYSVKAAAAFSKGDFLNVIENGKRSLELAPYDYDEYSTLSYMITYGISLYEKNGDVYSAEYCKEALLDVADMFDSAKKNLHPLADKIKDTFEDSLPEDIDSYITALREERTK